VAADANRPGWHRRRFDLAESGRLFAFVDAFPFCDPQIRAFIRNNATIVCFQLVSLIFIRNIGVLVVDDFW
jgi:hypothetical protein